MISMDLFKSNEQLRAERAAEKRAEYRQRLDMPSKAAAPTPKMEMRIGGMRMPEPQRQAPAPARPAAQKLKEASYIRGARMSMTPGETIGSHRLVSERSNAAEDTSMRGGRFPAAPLYEPGISGSGPGWKR